MHLIPDTSINFRFQLQTVVGSNSREQGLFSHFEVARKLGSLFLILKRK